MNDPQSATREELLAEAERLTTENETLRNYLRGVMWLMDQCALIRSTAHDGEPHFASRSVRFVIWLMKLCEAAGPYPGQLDDD